MPGLTRRRFLCLVAGAGGGLGLSAAGWFAPFSQRSGHDSAAPEGLQTLARTSWALGCETTITALHGDRRVAKEALQAAFAELELVEELMSLYRPHSQLSRLNRHGQLDDPHPYLVEVLQHAQNLAQQTGGAFDVTVQPLWEVYRRAKDEGRLPRSEEVAAARRRIGWRRLQVSQRRVHLRDGAAITLNGIAQGFAADRAAAALRAGGIEHALIDTGELGALGHRADGSAWTVGIQHPRCHDAYLSLAKLAGRSLATSGDYATTFSEDFRHHHLFDPRTGQSPAALASVSIAAPTAMAADALSTAVFVLGPEAGADLVRRTPGADGLLVLKDGRTLATEGFPLETG